MSPPLDAVFGSSEKLMATAPKSSPLSSRLCRIWIFFFASAPPSALLFCRFPACWAVPMYVRQGQKDFLVHEAGEVRVNFRAGDEKIVHFKFLGRFFFAGRGGGRVGRSLVGGGRQGVHVVHDFGEIVRAERIAFKGDFRVVDFDGADDDLVREN